MDEGHPATNAQRTRDIEQAELDRRALLKRAVAAGIVAWSTPVVLGSLTAPAGAVTWQGCHSYVVRITRNAGTGNVTTVVSSDLNCAPELHGLDATCPAYTRETVNGNLPVGTVSVSASYVPGQEHFRFSFSQTAQNCHIAGTAHTAGTSWSTACETAVTLSPTVGSPSSVTYDIPATNLDDVQAWAHVMVACT